MLVYTLTPVRSISVTPRAVVLPRQVHRSAALQDKVLSPSAAALRAPPKPACSLDRKRLGHAQAVPLQDLPLRAP